jgi:hypothetical protein
VFGEESLGEHERMPAASTELDDAEESEESVVEPIAECGALSAGVALMTLSLLVSGVGRRAWSRKRF